MGDRAGPQLQQARGRHHVYRAGRGRQGGCPTCHVSRVMCHVSRLMSRVTEHEPRGVRGADGAGGGEAARGQLSLRPVPLPGHHEADAGRAGGCRWVTCHVARVTCRHHCPCPGITGVHLMAQPLGYRTPDVGRYGWVTLPEFPYGEQIVCR